MLQFLTWWKRIFFTKNADAASPQLPRLFPGDIVRHFKRETIKSPDNYAYLYQILFFAEYTENPCTLVIYTSLQNNKVYARPYAMFMSEVDKKKYPGIKQKYRFEKISREGTA